MIDDLRLKAIKNVVEQRSIIHASKDRLTRHFTEFRFQLLLDLEEVVLRRLQQDDAAGTRSGNRLYQGRSNVAPSASYED